MPSNIVNLVDPDIIADLVRSGLETADLGARPVGAPELAAIGFNRKVDGYVIPYYKINGDLLPFYRIKLLDSKTKYRQPTGSVNHIYFPARFNDVLKKRLSQRDHKPAYVVLTEGEKKAAKGVKEGIPTCAVSGVYSWRNRTMYLPEETKLEPDHGRNNLIKISIPAGYSDIPEAQTLATGLLELIRTVSFYRIPLIICFDTDHRGIKTEVQTAAAQLGYELRHKGIALQHIRQLILPAEEEEKIGLDDYLVAEGVEAFEDLAKEVLNLRVAFPRHPNPREYLNLKLLKGKLGRREAQDLATAILCELDARGRRLHNKGTNSPYYFDEETHTLMPARLLQKHGEPMHESAFGSFLYKNFGISVGDTRLVTWLATQFTGEPPIEDVYPNRIMAQPKDEPESIALQISDSEFVVVRSDPNDPIRICSNGTHGLLFEQDQVDPLKGKEIVQEFKRQNAEKKIVPWWRDIFSLMNIAEGQVAADAQRDLATLLFYISPFLYRWRGTQLPAELVIGEADSGKSSLYALRLLIMTGRPSLRNMPNDIKDWYASVINNGGLHVVDNARFINKDLKQRVSDEMAQPLYVKVLTTKGYKCMGDIEVGDCVIGPEGEYSTVLQEHPQGVKPIYKVTLTDGSSTECCADHLWFVQTRDDLAYRDQPHGQILSLKKIMSKPLRYGGKTKRLRWYIPIMSDNIDLTRSDLSYKGLEIVTPYVMGCLLGDGHLSTRQIWLAATDKDIITRFTEELPVETSMNSCQKGSYYLRDASQLKQQLRVLHLIGTKARTKFVPELYLYTTYENRLGLLRGLMDTDGTVNSGGIAVFSTLSEKLAEAVRFLTQSLGGRSSLHQRSDAAFQVLVALPSGYNPFSCSRKRNAYGDDKRLRRAIASVELIGSQEAKCITISSPSGLYVTDNFIVTHNCRIVTEPYPHIEMRQLYTTSSQARAPVNCVFAITAIEQPFHNQDIIQRSAVLNFAAIKKAHDGDWTLHQLERYGGRLTWFVHHLVVLHRFLNGVINEGLWDTEYQATHRLAHYEQCLYCMGEVLGLDTEFTADTLKGITEATMSESDWTLEGIKAFADLVRSTEKSRFSSKSIADWAQHNEEYEHNPQLANPRVLGRYMQSHLNSVCGVARIKPSGTKNNRKMFEALDYGDEE